MAEKMKSYNVFKCPYCSCEYYDCNAKNGKDVGNPIIQCPNCSRTLFRKNILEPSLISGKRFFNIKFASAYAAYRTCLILIFAVFLFVILVTKNMTLAICFIAAAVLLYGVYEIIHAVHMKNYLESEEYDGFLTLSLKRMEDKSYAVMVMKSQGVDKNSVYYYETHRRD